MLRLETRLLVDLAGSLAGDYPQGVKCETVAREQARLDAAELAPRRKAPLFTVRAPNSVWQLGEFMDLPPIEIQRKKKLHKPQTSS